MDRNTETRPDAEGREDHAPAGQGFAARHGSTLIAIAALVGLIGLLALNMK